MYDRERQPATVKQLWKLNDLAAEIYDLKIKKLKIDGESPKGKGEYVTSQIILPLTKSNAGDLIEAFISLRDSLRDLVDHVEEHGAPADLHEILGVSRNEIN